MRTRLSGALLAVIATLAWAQMPSTTSVPAVGGDIVITALGHASVQLEQGGKVITVDPVANQADLSKAKPISSSLRRSIPTISIPRRLPSSGNQGRLSCSRPRRWRCRKYQTRL